MSHQTVERILGRLVTDEGFRRRFLRSPREALGEMAQGGAELNACELRCLMDLDPRQLERFAEGLDPRLQKADLSGEIL